jgi:hypothetical protein
VITVVLAGAGDGLAEGLAGTEEAGFTMIVVDVMFVLSAGSVPPAVDSALLLFALTAALVIVVELAVSSGTARR